MRAWKTLKDLQSMDDFEIIEKVKSKRYDFDGVLKMGFNIWEVEIIVTAYAGGLVWSRCDGVYYAYDKKSVSYTPKKKRD